MARLLPVALALACAAVHAQPTAYPDTPSRDAHVVTVSRSADGGFEFEVEGQDTDFEATLNPGGVLVVAATDGLRVLVATEDRGYYVHDAPSNPPLLAGPNAVWIDGRSRDEVGVLRVVPEIARGGSHTLEVSLLVCNDPSPGWNCTTWVAARPQRRLLRPEGEPAGSEAGLLLRILGGPVVYGPSPTDPPVRPVRD